MASSPEGRFRLHGVCYQPLLCRSFSRPGRGSARVRPATHWASGNAPDLNYGGHRRVASMHNLKLQTNGNSTGPMGARGVCVVLALISTSLWGAQKQGDKTAYLVARPGLSDPFFARSAVLMLPSTDLPLVIGLIINRPTHVELRQLFPQNRALQGKTDTAYFGGPVDIRDLSVVFRTPKPPKGAIRLVDDVYVSFDPHLMDTLLTNPQE